MIVAVLVLAWPAMKCLNSFRSPLPVRPATQRPPFMFGGAEYRSECRAVKCCYRLARWPKVGNVNLGRRNVRPCIVLAVFMRGAQT